jgi:hypothetical protein
VTTIAALATRALGTDFDSGYQADAERHVRTAIGKIFRSTTLARGDYTPAPISANVGVLSVTLPETGLRISTVSHLDTGVELDYAELAGISALQQITSPARGRPSSYAITDAGPTSEGTNLLLWPIPDRTYQLLVTGRFSPAAADLESADTAPLPVDYEELPVYWARYELYSVEGDSEMMRNWLDKWTTGVLELRGDLQKRRTGNRQVPGHWSTINGAGPTLHHPRGLF